MKTTIVSTGPVLVERSATASTLDGDDPTVE
jgi:hypothetical protein